MLLQEESQGSNEPSFPRPLLSKWFILREVDKECTLNEFQNEHKIDSSKCNMFLEHDSTHGDRNILDVMLMKKVQQLILSIVYLS